MIEKLVEFLSDAIQNAGAWTGLVFALIAFGESTAFVGAIIPCTPILFLVGGLLAAGKVTFLEIVPGAIIGAIAGYAISYVAGERLRGNISSNRWLKHQRRSIARARLFFRRYGGISLIVGRYTLGPFQSLLPFVAGAAGMNRRRFSIYCLISGVIWVPLTLAPGYIATRGAGYLAFGKAWQDAATSVIIIVSGGAVLLCIAFAVLRPLYKYSIGKLSPPPIG